MSIHIYEFIYEFIYEYIKNVFIYELRLDRSRRFPVDDTTVLTTTWEGLHPVDIVVEVVQRRVERDHCCDLLLVHAVVPWHALALEERVAPVGLERVWGSWQGAVRWQSCIMDLGLFSWERSYWKSCLKNIVKNIVKIILN